MSEANTVGDPKDMRIDGDRRLPERLGQHDIRRFTTHAGKLFQMISVAGDRAVVLVDEDLRKGENVAGLHSPKTDCPYVAPYFLFTQRDHLFRRIGDAKKLSGRSIDGDIRSLSR